MVIILADDGVVESGLLRVVDGFVYLLLVAADAFDECWLEILQANLVKRISTVGGVEGFKKRILALLCCWLHVLGRRFQSMLVVFICRYHEKYIS